MAKRIQRIGYIEYDTGRKIDIINARRLDEYNSVQIVATDGMYLYREYAEEQEKFILGYNPFVRRIKTNRLYKVEFDFNKSTKFPMLIIQSSFKQFVLFTDKKERKIDQH